MRIEKDVTIDGQTYRLKQAPAASATLLWALAWKVCGGGWLDLESEQGRAARENPSTFFGMVVRLGGASEADVARLFALIKPCTTLVQERQINASTDGTPIVQKFATVMVGEPGAPDLWEEHFAGAYSLHPWRLLMEHLAHNFDAAFLAETRSSKGSSSSESSTRPRSSPGSSPTNEPGAPSPGV